MAAGPEIVVRYLADTAKLAAANAELEKGGSRAGTAVKKAFVPAVAVLGGVAVGAKKAMDAASGLNESVNAVQVTFGEASKSVLDFSEKAATEAGLSMQQFNELVTPVGASLQNTGMSADEAAKASINLAKRAADMASVFNTDVADAMGAIQAGLRGEADPLERFGVGLSDAAVKAKAMAMGLAESEKALTAQDKAQARMALLMQQTSKFQGDFKNTSDSAANAQRILAAETENLQASLGQGLLPVMQLFFSIMRKVTGLMTEHQGATKAAVVAITALAAGIVAVNLAMKAWAAIQMVVRAATLAWTAAQWLLNAALTANPIGLVVVAIGALIAAFVLAWQHSETFRRIVTAAFDAVKAAALVVFNWLKANWPLLLGILAGPFGLAIALIIRHWDGIKSAVSDAVGKVKGYLTQLGTFFSDKAADVVAAIGRIVDWLKKPGEAAADMLAAIKSAVGAIAGFISGEVGKIAAAVSRVVNAIKTPINAVLSAWNRISFSVPKFDIPGVSVMGKEVFGGATIGGQTFQVPQIPLLARGGVVSTPTLAMLGEGRGREIVAPESLLRAIVGERPVSVRVFIGDQELRGLVRTEIVESDTALARTLIAGARG